MKLSHQFTTQTGGKKDSDLVAPNSENWNNTSRSLISEDLRRLPEASDAAKYAHFQKTRLVTALGELPEIQH